VYDIDICAQAKEQKARFTEELQRSIEQQQALTLRADELTALLAQRDSELQELRAQHLSSALSGDQTHQAAGSVDFGGYFGGTAVEVSAEDQSHRRAPSQVESLHRDQASTAGSPQAGAGAFDTWRARTASTDSFPRMLAEDGEAMVALQKELMQRSEEVQALQQQLAQVQRDNEQLNHQLSQQQQQTLEAEHDSERAVYELSGDLAKVQHEVPTVAAEAFDDAMNRANNYCLMVLIVDYCAPG